MKKKCRLCNENPADKTGSHIVPHFLAKRIINEEGTRERDKELGFKISQDKTESYFGKAILPEKLEEIYGEVTDELIKNNKVDGIVDYYFCSDCEKRFGVVENEYAKTLNKATSIGENYVSEKTPFLGFLFWSSIVWRLSIQEKSGFELKPKEEKKLVRILNKYLVSDIKSLTSNKADSDLNDIGYKIIRSPKFSDQFSTWLHWSPDNKRPYSLIIDEYLIFLYFKKNYLTGMVEDFYGSDKFKKMATFNTPFTVENIFGISFNDYKFISENLAIFGAKERIGNLNYKLDMIHQFLGGEGKSMYPNYKTEIMKRIANSEVAIGKRGTTKEYVKIIINTIYEIQNT